MKEVTDKFKKEVIRVSMAVSKNLCNVYPYSLCFVYVLYTFIYKEIGLTK